MKNSEELREALLNLEEARKREENQRRIAESLLDGLRILVLTENPDELFIKLFQVLQKPLSFEAAFVLTTKDDELLHVEATSDDLFSGLIWQPRSMFKRVIDGLPVSVFDTELIEEWRLQPDKVRRAVSSALHFSINTPERKAIFICTHSERGHFSRVHLLLARRFSILATQALQKLDSENKMTNLKAKLETEAKLAELNHKLMQSEKKLARAKKMEAVGLLAGGVAHDLNNILSGIVSYPQLLLINDYFPSEFKDVIKTIHESGIKAAAVVEDLLTVAKGVASHKEQINLNYIIQDYLRSPEYENIDHSYPDISVKTNLDPDLFNIKASRVHLAKVLMNLVSNAFDAASNNSEGSVLIATENCFLDKPLKGYEDVREGEYVILTVSDNGFGIAEDDLDRIFEPFYTTKVMGKNGTGLGLTIVWNTVQDHNGYVNISTDNNGTVFSIYFPINRETLSNEIIITELKQLKGNGEKILVIDDLEQQRKISSSMLTVLGYSVDTVSSGEEAVEYVKKHSVDLVVLDMIMEPGINGRETYKRILKIRPKQKAIIVSGFSMTEEVKKTQRLGAGQYIKKPYTLETIGQIVKTELSR